MFRISTVALAVLLAVPLAPGQDRRSPDEDVSQLQTLEVFLPVMVFDKNDQFVGGLERRNFRVFEDGKEQQIQSFDAPTAMPLSIAVLLDTSASVKRKLKFEQEAAVSFVMSMLENSKDQALFATFDSVVTLHVDFTRNTGDLSRAIDKVKASGQTRMYDAVNRVCEEKLSQLPPGVRPIIVIITDGEDTESDSTLEDAIQMAQRSNVTVFGVSTRNYSDISAGMVRGSVDADFARLCEETGGRTFLPYQRLELEQAFAGIRKFLRSQYVIYYTPTDQTRNGKFREIKVKLEGVEQKVDVRAKRGYYATAPNPNPVPR
jgi:Ca-activated chloride channel family protein